MIVLVIMGKTLHKYHILLFYVRRLWKQTWTQTWSFGASFDECLSSWLSHAFQLQTIIQGRRTPQIWLNQTFVGKSIVVMSGYVSLSSFTDSSQPSLSQPSLTLQSFPYGGCESVEISYQSGTCITSHILLASHIMKTLFYCGICVQKMGLL